ncbi:MAG: hydrogenase formation protein HypD [Chlorobi bacterium]|nr:hydrogenase formation protein HypD [Chlorobiota bacterium]
MKYLDEFRDAKLAKYFVERINKISTKKCVIMEVCGGQTHSIIQNGIDQVLPENIEMVHGPGCPVCVTPLETLDRAIKIAKKENVIFASFGDMLRVPGSDSDLLKAKSEGADVRIVYSALEALKIARENPDKEIVFLAIGFETTAPGNALAILQAEKEGLANFSEIVSHVLVPPAMETILSSEDNRVQAFLAAGHVCTVMGYWEYEPIAEKYKVPIVPTGFEPVDILNGIFLAVKQIEEGKAFVENQYTRSVKREGNIAAQNLLKEIFVVADQKWRGIGMIPMSGMNISQKYEKYDAAKKFDVTDIITKEPEKCQSGLVLRGNLKPNECAAFGKECTPENPLGATMVSSEGACAAYFKFKRFNVR